MIVTEVHMNEFMIVRFFEKIHPIKLRIVSEVHMNELMIRTFPIARNIS